MWTSLRGKSKSKMQKLKVQLKNQKLILSFDLQFCILPFNF